MRAAPEYEWAGQHRFCEFITILLKYLVSGFSVKTANCAAPNLELEKSEAAI
jgi:hypothetical protein